MDILINGNDGKLNQQKFGVVHRADDGTVTFDVFGTTGALGKSEHAATMDRVMAKWMMIRRGDGSIDRIERDDPNWFYSLPLGLHGTLMYAEPTDWPAWKAIVAKVFGYKATV